MKNIKIVVTGDICMNNLIWTANPENSEGYNWQGHTNVHTLRNPGESLLLARMIAQTVQFKVTAPEISEEQCCEGYLSSYTELDLFRISDRNRAKVYRVGKFLGFKGTETGEPYLLPIKEDDPNAEIVVIDDENNGFNRSMDFWPQAIRNTSSRPIVIYKMNNPIGTNLLWQHLDRFHIEKMIVVINADDLRSKGVNISKSISWEKTALDFVWQLNNNPNLSFLADCRHLVVPFGLEGVIYYRNPGTAEACLYFLPYEFEGDFFHEDLGYMYGLTSCFVAGMTGIIAEGFQTEEFSELISKGIRVGMAAARKYYNAGFGNDLNNLSFPDSAAFQNNSDDADLMEHVQSVKIPFISDSTEQMRWFILKEKNSANLADIAFDLVKNGDEKVLKYIPTARFGDLKVVDRTEVESYRSIRNLLSEYINAVNVSRPLSIAVFGTPGSGKSYGVTEIAASIAPGQIQRLVYNLSQFHSSDELIRAFHKISDYSLLGKIPFIIFDEFDSDFEGSLGWLKYFLAPMQDGVYREEETIHPIGKAIFVFAGGTSSTFREFCGDDIENEEELRQFGKKFKASKGPDFVSRLRGYVNILGPNRTSLDDQLYIIRRAMLLRSLIERKLPQMINEKGTAQVDNGVIRAMLKIPRFKHETRSMEAIIEMSRVNRAKRWDQSLLPPKEQLSLHVDEDQFLRYLMHDAIFGEKVEEMASALRQEYNELFKNQPVYDDDGVKSWEAATEQIKEFFRAQAKSIPDALLHIQCDVIYIDSIPGSIEFTEMEIEQLSKYEYKRRTNKYRETGSVAKTENPVYMIGWDQADPLLKNQIRHMVSLWGKALASSRFKVERLKIED